MATLSAVSLPSAGGREPMLVGLAAAHGLLLLVVPWAPVIALGLWWNSNTIAHNFIHRPFFATRRANRAFSLYLTLLLGIPQDLWRQRHLAHHAGTCFRLRWQSMWLECAAVALLWTGLAALAPRFLLTIHLPGYAAGLLLCALHGHFEHAVGTTSHYGRLYNLLFFNDGYHAEHHRSPGVRWAALPRLPRTEQCSRWPAPLRFLDTLLSLLLLKRLNLVRP